MLAESNLSPICSDLVSALCASRLELLAFNINLNEALLAYVKMLLHYFLREELQAHSLADLNEAEHDRFANVGYRMVQLRSQSSCSNPE